VRTNNEDRFGYDSRRGIYVVCDGMGGEAAGEVASRIAVDAMLDHFRQADRSARSPIPGFEGVSTRARTLAGAIRFANQAIRNAARQDPTCRGMGSTIVAVLVEGGSYSVGHIGDSRIYLLRNGNIQQLTEDHSLVMEQVRRGLITQEQAQCSEMQNVLDRALGTNDTVEPDLSDMAAEAGDTLLLTSDGLTRHVSNREILQIASSAPSLAQACQSLIEAAKEAGGDDNITCVLLRFVKQSWFGSMFKTAGHSGPK
jgi:protein phosphatase